MSKTLENRTVQAFYWSFLERFSAQAVQFVYAIIMARLLLPEEFGLIAIVTIFMSFAQAFVNSGFGQALIQKQNATHIDECSIFYFNLFVAIFAACLLFHVAPWIGDFYNQPKIIDIAQALSVSLVINSLGLVQRALLTKKLHFKTQLKISLTSLALSGLVGIVLASNGHGVWSLVVLYILNDLCETLLIWRLTSWRPSLTFSFVSLQSMFPFGSRLLLVSILNAIFSNIYALIIAKFFTASSLGLYARADSLSKFPVTILNTVVSQVTFSTFSSLQNDRNLLKKYASQVLSTVALFAFPLMIGLAIVARPLVEVLLTGKWIQVVPYLQLLCVIGLINSFQRINYNCMNALGRSDLFLRVEVIDKILILFVVAITFDKGIEIMIFGQIFASVISYCVNTFYTGRLMGYSLMEQSKALFPALAMSSVMGLSIFPFKYIFDSSQLALLSIQVVAGALIYACLCYYFKVDAFMTLVKLGHRIPQRA